MKLRKTLRLTAAFSLIEISYLLLIFAILSVGTLTIVNFQENNRPRLYLGTSAKLDEVENALLAFLAENGRMPCPASLTFSPEDELFGTELYYIDSTNEILNCDISKSDGGMIRINVEGEDYIFHGALPVRTLNLADEYGWDTWNTKIEFVVQTPFVNNDETNPNATDKADQDLSTEMKHLAFSGQDPTLNPGDGDLEIEGVDGVVISEEPVYVLISHGENQSFGFTVEGEALSKPNNDLEEKNSIYNTDGHSRVYSESAGPSKIFNDSVRFKGRRDIVDECNNQLEEICKDKWSIKNQ